MLLFALFYTMDRKNIKSVFLYYTIYIFILSIFPISRHLFSTVKALTLSTK